MEFMSERERLVAEQAVLAFRAVQEAADKAQWGHGLETVEDAVLEQGREQQRRMLNQAMEAASQKRTLNADVPDAGDERKPNETSTRR
jgi:hypothetical protein